MTYYNVSGSRIDIIHSAQISEALPVGTYSVKVDMNGTFFLEKSDEFQITGKIYGDTEKVSDRFLNTFDLRPNGTGVLLTGEKGSGKTFLSKLLSVKAAKRGYSTLLINAPYRGEGFNTFLTNIDTPSVVIFDEFEKVYNPEQQAEILTLLDGVHPSKKMFVMTCNDIFKLSDFMLNRPGRFFYKIEYRNLSEEFVREYCEDNLKDKGKIDEVVRLSNVVFKFNFDMLKAIVEEMNRYNEDVLTAVKYLNIDTKGSRQSYDVVSVIKLSDDAQFNNDNGYTISMTDEQLKDYTEFSVNDDQYFDPYGGPANVELRLSRDAIKRKRMEEQKATNDDEDVDDEYDYSAPTDSMYVRFNPQDIKTVDVKGRITYSANGLEVMIKKHHVETFTYRDLL